MLNELISCCVIGINTFISSIFGHIPFLHSLFMAFLNVELGMNRIPYCLPYVFIIGLASVMEIYKKQ